MTISARSELDLRQTPSTGRHAVLQARLDELPEGESIVLTDSRNLLPVFEELRASREGRFLWVPRSAAGSLESAEVLRLKPKTDESQMGDFFGRDHDEIDAILMYFHRDLQKVLQSGEPSEVPLLKQFVEFNRRLERHIVWEEETLFPAVESLEPSLAQGPGLVMRREHVLIRQAKAQILSLLDRKGPRDLLFQVGELLDEMIGILMNHNHKEEAMYYPLCDKLFQEKQRSAVLSVVRKP